MSALTAARPGRRRRGGTRGIDRAGAGSLVLGTVILVILLFPLYWMVNTALQPGTSAAELSWFPRTLDLGNFRRAWESQAGNLLTSLLVALGAVAVCLVVATPAAYALARFRLPGTRTVVFGTLITQMVPGIVVANALYNAYVELNLVNSYLGLILADASLGIPFTIVLLRAFMVSIPGEVVEAAMVDGAGRMRTLLRVVVPMSRNALITGGLFTFLFAWSDFLFALTLNTTDAVKPVTLGIYEYIGAHVGDWGAVMAVATLSSIPAAVLLVVAQKYVAAGISGGSIK
ncbi:carbohydrate ABC transporter permease [Marinactinospora thermotolerans]|uniref:Carbohydrate ABC transporter membrane protein 2, CUT1 family n=1 Tax=Marinactinospora thermotolerans DSM 45154 TaxID=1122192 RepID=A0A1T4TCC2_9ACTN|nr:carbohydrate ABC transporter permease [Marinactinospora thermotolerans]SKA38073.1 carbohydrate ABC transporter membrane protein 2, CUT1 family [Marinactinospora thermotolerans DSM 45154]